MGVWLGDPGGVSAVPTDLYRHQAACREIGFLRQLPHTLTTLPMPAGLTRIERRCRARARRTLQNPVPTAPQLRRCPYAQPPSVSPARFLSPAHAAHAASVLGLSSPPLHVIIAVDMTGSSKNPAFQYAPQARLIAQNVLLNQVRSGDTVTLLQVCSGVKTVADFTYQGAGGARMPKSDILRYSNALTTPCKGKGSAITAGFSAALTAGQRTKDAREVVVYFTDGALLDDPQRAALPGVFSKLLGRSTATVFIAGLSPESERCRQQRPRHASPPSSANRRMTSGSFWPGPTTSPTSTRLSPLPSRRTANERARHPSRPTPNSPRPTAR